MKELKQFAEMKKYLSPVSLYNNLNISINSFQSSEANYTFT